MSDYDSGPDIIVQNVGLSRCHNESGESDFAGFA